MVNIQKQMFYKAFLTSVITEFTQISALLVDNIITTKCLGATEVAAVGLASPMFFLIGVISCCFSVGLQIKCSNEIGCGNINKANELYNETLKACLFTAVFTEIILFLFVPKLTILFGAHNQALQTNCAHYLYGLLFELIPYVCLSVLISVAALIPDGNKIIIASSLIGGITDIIFDLGAVSLHPGTFGIGLATSLSVFISAVVTFLWCQNRSEIVKLKQVALNRKDLKEIIQLGIPKAIHGFANMINPIVINYLVLATGGTCAMAVMSCKSSISDFLEIPAVGISGAVVILAGIAYGEKNKEDLSLIMKTASIYGVCLSFVLLLLLIPGSAAISEFYFGGSSDSTPMMQFMLICLGISLPFDFYIFTQIGYLEAVNSVNHAYNLEILSGLISPVLWALLFGKLWGIYGIFASCAFARFFVSLLIFYTKHKGTENPLWKLPDSFDLNSQDCIIRGIRSMEECIEISKQILIFCKNHHMKEQKAFHAALVIEELTTNTLEHGTRKHSRPISIDLRVVYTEDTLIMRIRDNSDYFNITEYEETADGDPEENLGIRLILASAENLKYYRIWDTNTVLLEYFNN